MRVLQSPRFIEADKSSPRRVFNSGDTVYLSSSKTVSSATNSIVLAAGQETILRTGAWVISAGQSELTVSFADINRYSEPEGSEPSRALKIAAGALSPYARAQAVNTAAAATLEPTITQNGTATLTGTKIEALKSEALNTEVPWEYRGADIMKSSTFVTVREQRRLGERKAKTGYPWQIAFVYDGEAFEIEMSGASEPMSYRVWADDKVSAYRTQTIAKKFDKISFGSRAKRRILIEIDYGMYFGGIVPEATATVTASIDGSGLKIAWKGDSYVDGANCHTNESSTPPASCQGWIFTASRLLGVTNFRMYGMPGTGYTNKNEVGTYVERSGDEIEYAPDVIVVQGSINDKAKTQAQMEAAVGEYISTVRSALPNALIIGTTPVPVTNAQRTENEANVAGIKAAFASAGLPCIDAFGAKLIFGTGKVGATTGDGNADYYHNQWDESHPSLAGHQHLANYFAGRVARILGVGL